MREHDGYRRMVDDEGLLPDPWERRRRTLHIVDLENLVGPSHADGDRYEFEHALAEYSAASNMNSDDPVMVGVHPGLLFVAQQSLGTRGRIFTGHGADGADRALLDAADAEFIARRFHLVSLGTGDHIFAPLARELTDRRVRVTVVGREGRTSADLLDCAHVQVLLPPLHEVGVADRSA